ncbi:hypothetical protein NFI96_030332 [Prochilodus magdalenae]|nr:hypothetical protein NFI96_030332 [Prochilodus magdalenae]
MEAVHYCSRAQKLRSSTKLTCRVTFIRVSKVNISQSRMEDIYANTGVTTDHRRSSDSGGPSYEDIYTNEDNTKMCKTRNKQTSYGTETAGEVEETSPSHTADPQYREMYTASRGCRRLAAVCLGLLCVLLLTAIIVLWIKLSNLTIDRDRLQTSYTSLTKERDQLQTSYTSLTTERDQLQTSFTNLTKERDQLQTSFTNLTIERDQLQTSYTNLAVERDRLQTSYTKLTVERDQLQTRFTNLELSYMEVVNERDQLKKKPCSADENGESTTLSKPRQVTVTALHLNSIDKPIDLSLALYQITHYSTQEEREKLKEADRAKGADLMEVSDGEESEGEKAEGADLMEVSNGEESEGEKRS